MLPNTCACITHKNMQNFMLHSCLQISYQACLKCSWADVDESCYWSESEIPLILLVWAVTDIHTDIIEAHSLHISWKRKQGQLLSKSRSKKGVKPEEGFCGQRFYSAQKFVLVHTYTDTILYVWSHLYQWTATTVHTYVGMVTDWAEEQQFVNDLLLIHRHDTRCII